MICQAGSLTYFLFFLCAFVALCDYFVPPLSGVSIFIYRSTPAFSVSEGDAFGISFFCHFLLLVVKVPKMLSRLTDWRTRKLKVPKVLEFFFFNFSALQTSHFATSFIFCV